MCYSSITPLKPSSQQRIHYAPPYPAPITLGTLFPDHPNAPHPQPPLSLAPPKSLCSLSSPSPAPLFLGSGTPRPPKSLCSPSSPLPALPGVRLGMWNVGIWERNSELQSTGMGFLLPLLTIPCFPEPESGWNFKVVLGHCVCHHCQHHRPNRSWCQGNTLSCVGKAAPVAFRGSLTLGAGPTSDFLSLFKPYELPAQPHRSHPCPMDPHHSPTDPTPFPQTPVRD